MNAETSTIVPHTRPRRFWMRSACFRTWPRRSATKNGISKLSIWWNGPSSSTWTPRDAARPGHSRLTRDGVFLEVSPSPISPIVKFPCKTIHTIIRSDHLFRTGPFCQIGKTFVGAANTVSAKRLGVPHILLTQTASTHVPDLVRKINFYLMRDDEVRNDL